jgi:hypothetical protein
MNQHTAQSNTTNIQQQLIDKLCETFLIDPENRISIDKILNLTSKLDRRNDALERMATQLLPKLFENLKATPGQLNLCIPVLSETLEIYKTKIPDELSYIVTALAYFFKKTELNSDLAYDALGSIKNIFTAIAQANGNRVNGHGFLVAGIPQYILRVNLSGENLIAGINALSGLYAAETNFMNHANNYVNLDLLPELPKYKLNQSQIIRVHQAVSDIAMEALATHQVGSIGHYIIRNTFVVWDTFKLSGEDAALLIENRNVQSALANSCVHYQRLAEKDLSWIEVEGRRMSAFKHALTVAKDEAQEQFCQEWLITHLNAWAR